MERTIKIIDGLNEKVGSFISNFNHLLVLLICLDVVMRYLFNFSKIWIMELELYFYSLIFLWGSAFALKHERHVRVDLFYSKMSARGKAIVDLIGGVLFLLPWCIVIMIVSFDYALISFKIGESSSQPGGLPALYILKFAVFIGFTLLFLQGISSILKSISFFAGTKKYYISTEHQ